MDEFDENMNELSSSNITSLKNILTLRYDLTQKIILPKITPRDFHNSTPTITEIENIIEKSLIKTKPKRIAIALSGGVDSTLALHFLKKSFPLGLWVEVVV